MNKELLSKRLQDIEAAIKQTMANYNMLEGNRSECSYWLSQLEKDERVELKEVSECNSAA